MLEPTTRSRQSHHFSNSTVIPVLSPAYRTYIVKLSHLEIYRPDKEVSADELLERDFTGTAGVADLHHFNADPD